MKLGKCILALLLALCMLAVSIPSLAETAEERATVRVMAKRYRSGTERDLTTIETSDTYAAFDSLLAAKGVKIEWEAIANEQYDTVVMTRLAGGNDLPDFMPVSLTDAEALNYGENGLLLDVLAAIKEYDEDGSILAFWQKYYPEVFGMLTTENGAMYWLPGLMSIETFVGDTVSMHQYPGNRFTVCVRQDWLDKIGKEYTIGAITMDELYDMLKAFQEKDANGNGLADEVVSVNIASYDTGFAQMFGLPIKLVWPNTTTGEVECFWYNEGLKDYITFMKKLVADGLYDTARIGNSSVGDTMIAENRVSSIYTYAVQGWIEPSVAGVDNAVYAPVYPETGYKPSLKAESAVPVISDKFVIPASCQNVKAVVALMDALYTEEYAMLCQYGIEGVGYEYGEDGRAVSMVSYGTDSKNPDAKGIPFAWLTYGMPRVQIILNTEENWRYHASGAFPIKSEMNAWILENTDHDRQDNVAMVGAMTGEEVEKMNEIENTLSTFSTETLTQLILGNYSLDELDTYVNEMKNLGLDDYLAIWQARMDRYNAAMGK